MSVELATVFSRALLGVHSPQVTIEVHLSRGLPSLSIVGLPETAVKESKDRVRSAILNNHFEFPLNRITINLAPADLPKEGGRYDLPIALGILAASNQINSQEIADYEFIGELALTGKLRSIPGILPTAKTVKDANRKLILPMENADEAALIEGLTVLPAKHLSAVCAHFNGTKELEPYKLELNGIQTFSQSADLSDVRAQHQAKRALEIAAAGNHNLLMLGPPGTGKTMLAERLPGILPAMSDEEALETAAIMSISNKKFDAATFYQRPFRAPHHTASAVALVGGGSNPRPGEISLAHHGVLFLDEFPEFDRKVLEVLREPLESGHIIISRAAHQTEFPASFQLVAAMNPCPCGYLGDSSGRCHCGSDQIRRYRSKISGPLLDRIDMHIEIPNTPKEILRENKSVATESSKDVRKRVEQAYSLQLRRSGKPNSKLTNKEIEREAKLTDKQLDLLERAISQLQLSTRAVHRIIKVARTISDLEQSKSVETEHLTEAINYRRLERTQDAQF